MSYVTWTSVLMWTTPGQVGLWKLNLFWQLWSNSILVGLVTSAIGNVISSSFRAYVEHPNQRSYAYRVLSLMKGGPGL
jgi:hypothetical protein